MKTEATITTFTRKAGIGSVINSKQKELSRQLAAFYSAMIEEQVTPEKAVRIANAQAAFIAMLLCSTGSLLYSAACAAWFAIALLKCRQG